MRSAQPGFRGWVLYDDSCGFCNWWIPAWASILRSNGFLIASLQEDWVVRRLSLQGSEILEDLRLLRPDGSQAIGADVYRVVMRTIWWAYPMYVASILPVCRRVFDECYRTFKRNRYRISRSCGLTKHVSSREHDLGDLL